MSSLAIIGSRSFSDLDVAMEAFRDYCCDWNESGPDKERRYYQGYHSRFDTIVSGGARGADSVGAEIARKWGLKLVEHLPDWQGLGKRAGFVRNETIIKDADVVLAFWGIDPKTGELSKGTQHSIGLAKKMRKTTIIVYV